MAIFVLPLVLMMILVAVLYGCWWIFPVVLVAAFVGMAGYYSWRWAGRIGAAPGGFRAWWAANRERLAWAMSIFLSLVLGAIIVWCLVSRFAPDCTGGCLSQPAGVITSTTTEPTGSLSPRSLVVRAGEPATLTVPPGHRWDLVGNIPTRGWTTDAGHRDERGNRIQVFEVVDPVREIELQVKLTLCTTAQMCAW